MPCTVQNSGIEAGTGAMSIKGHALRTSSSTQDCILLQSEEEVADLRSKSIDWRGIEISGSVDGTSSQSITHSATDCGDC